ncbi:SRPBCC domain-containing protein [Saccharicrinis sp. FJH62]|uniref:SRPBCC family protein n=1 Tax=Saccharicrinis sp. FJH62 TaxID=3344657 RepID=UPI0035D4E07E
MKSSLLLNFSVDKENKQILVNREFDAGIELVWSAWTESELLDKWWAPKPWKVTTKKMDFRVGGFWLYAMMGPDGEENYSRSDFSSIRSLENFSSNVAFCDSEGNVEESAPRSKWYVDFTSNGERTIVRVLLTFDELNDLEMMVNMGFREGFLSAFENLDEIFENN